jgi:hypothetical protein
MEGRHDPSSSRTVTGVPHGIECSCSKFTVEIEHADRLAPRSRVTQRLAALQVYSEGVSSCCRVPVMRLACGKVSK